MERKREIFNRKKATAKTTRSTKSRKTGRTMGSGSIVKLISRQASTKPIAYKKSLPDNLC